MGTLLVEGPALAELKVEQLEHEFWFGAALANQAFDGRMAEVDARRYREAFLRNFNAAVTENALKWPSMEPERGAVNYATVDAMLALTGEHGIPLRGRNIFWGVSQFVQPWVKELDDETLRATLKARAADIGRRYAGRFAEYDLNNEMIHGNFYEDRTLKLTPEEEQAKAQAIVDYYTLCFAHPAVDGILMWGLWEGANWIPASSLYQLDWTPTPAAEAYQDLVYKKWWTSWGGQTDRKGQRRVPAFYGTYRISCDGETRTVHLRKDEGVARVSF